MLYCVKCHELCADDTTRCPGCKNSRLRPVSGADMVLLHRADEFTAKRLAERFDTAGIVYRLEPAATGLQTPLYDSSAMPTDRIILVRYDDLEAAKGFSRELEDELARERQAEEEFEEMPLKKRLVVQTLSIILFMLLVMVAVFGADAFANWLKSLF